MTAKLLSFTQQRGGWGNVEMAQFARIQRLLENVGLHIDVEHGITDEGDPWCVFCSNTTGEVIIHAARMDGLYMFDSPVLRTPIEGRSFQHCAEKFLDEAMQAIPVVRRRSTLQVHPSALLASVFLTIVLHAQATSEHSPFRSEGHADVLAELDASGKHGAGWIKLIAQHLAELFGPQDNSNNGPHNQQMSTWVTVIPAGLTVSVLGIVHELVTGDDKLLLVFDETIGVENAHDNADHDLPQILAAAEAAAPEVVAVSDDGAAVTTVASDDAGDDKLEAKVAETATAEDLAPVVLEVPGAYMALAHSFVEEVVAFATDAVTALATAGMTMVAQAEEARDNAGVEVAQADSPAVATISTIATATIAQLKPLMDSDMMEFISLPDDASAALILAAYGENRGGDVLDVATGDTGTVSGPAIDVPAPTTPDDVSGNPAPVDVVTQLDWLIDIADNVGFKQSGGNYIIYDKDVAFHQNPDDWLIETFVMADRSEITFIGVAADYDGLLV